MKEVVVAGVGMHEFGRFPEKTVIDMGVTATERALEDAGLEWKQVQLAYVGYLDQGMAAGSRILFELGRTGIPILNIESASCSGNAALREAHYAVATGRCDIALALGVGKMGRLMPAYTSTDPHEEGLRRAEGIVQAGAPMAMTARRRMVEFGATMDQYAKVSVKAHKNASMNPYAQYRKTCTIEEVHASRMIYDPLTALHFCPTGDGAAAAIVCTRAVAERWGRKPYVSIVADAMGTGLYRSPRRKAENLTGRVVREASEQCGAGILDMDLIQVHDGFTVEEVLHYEALGLAAEGEGEKLIDEGVTEIGGRHPVNTDGGLLSRGHPIGPTGLAQIWETVTQLRGEAGARQVENARQGLVQCVGTGDVCFIQVFRR